MCSATPNNNVAPRTAPYINNTIVANKNVKLASVSASIRGVSVLMYAAQQGDVHKVRKIIREQPELLYVRDRTGKTPLHYCSTSDSVCAAQAADYLVMAAPELVGAHDEDGYTPLHLAAIAGNMQLVTFLLANKADVNAVDHEKHTVVHWATVCGETGALGAVLAAGAPVSTPDIHGGYPLHYAAQMCGNDKDSRLGLQVLQLLLSHSDIVVSVQDGDGRQPLLWAASAGSAKAILALIRAGASVEAHDKDGLTALHCAASRGHTDCLDCLLTLCGASPDVIDNNGCTALHYAVTLGHADATALLLAHGADPNRQDRKGRSAAHCGCAKGQFETVKMIGNYGANLWSRNARGDLPLHEAAASGRRDLVKWLLDQRPSQVNARNNDGRCPLHLAALNDNADMCKILLDAGAQINPVLRTSKSTFLTPLDCALQRGFRSTAKYLQLQGGVPATRLADRKSGNVNLRIRDDVTFWGDTSEDSERENGEKDKVNKRIHRKKMAMNKLSKKRVMSGGSDLESGRLLSGRGESRTKRKLNAQKNVGLKTGDNADSAANRIDCSKRNPGKTPTSSGRFDYTNEIVINGKTEINIHQTKQITISSGDVNQSTIAEDLPQQLQVPIIKHKRPESAKPSKSRQASPQSVVTKAKTQKSAKRKQNKVETTPKSEETESKNLEVKDSKEIPENRKNLVNLDAQERNSVMSNTSEDVEEEKVTVEAAIHEPPKKLEQEKITEDVKQTASLEEKKPDVSTSDKAETQVVEDSDEKRPTTEEIVASESKEVDEIQVIPGNEVETKLKTDEQVVVEKEVKDEPKLENAEEKQEVVKTEEEKAASEENEEQQILETEKQNQERKPTDTNFEDNEEIANLETENKEVAELEKDPPKTRRKKRETDVEKDQTNENLESGRSSEISDLQSDSNTSTSTVKDHKSFRVLDEQEAADLQKKTTRNKLRKQRSRSEGTKVDKEKPKKSKIPTPLQKTGLSKSDKYLHTSERRHKSSMESLPQIVKDPPKTELNITEPGHSEGSEAEAEKDSASEAEDVRIRSGSVKKRRLRRRSRIRDAKSAGSEYESSNVIDSGFEPSPRSSRIPKSRNISERGVNMTSVTRSIQSNIRRYHLERKIFGHLLDLKRMQIRAGQHNEAILVKRAIDSYHNSCAATVGAGKYIPEDYTFKSFEKFLYLSLRKLQRNGADYLKGLPEAQNPLLCTQSTHRCMHATHAYTGIPCAAYLPKMDHHTIPKIGFASTECKPGTGAFLPNINAKKAVTLELCHGSEKQIISLPADKLNQNKRYYVTFTVKGSGRNTPNDEENDASGHTHAKSD